MMATANVRTVLEDIKSRVNGIAVALVSHDGRLLSAHMPAGAYTETFAVMCATIFGAAAAGNAELRRAPPERVVVEGGDSKTIVARADGNALLVVVVDGSRDLPQVLDWIAKFAGVLEA
jgi:predicted regulator of Ras-like GTPase activity (Roadblock/LC7/MglB family)